MFISSTWDVKEPTHYSKRVPEVLGVVAVLCESIAGPHQLKAAKTQPAQSNKQAITTIDYVREFSKVRAARAARLLFNQSDHCFVASLSPLPSSIGSFSINDGNGNDNATN